MHLPRTKDCFLKTHNTKKLKMNLHTNVQQMILVQKRSRGVMTKNIVSLHGSRLINLLRLTLPEKAQGCRCKHPDKYSYNIHIAWVSTGLFQCAKMLQYFVCV